LDSLQKTFATAKDKKDSTDIREKIESLNKDVMNYRSNVVKSNPGTFVAMLFKAMTIPEPSKEEEEAAKAKGDSAYQVFKYYFYKNHFFDNIDFNDDRITRTPIYHQKLKEFISNLTVPNVDSIAKASDWLIAKTKNNKELFKYTVWYITTTHETSQLMGADAVYVHMVDKYYKTKQAYWVDTATLKKIIDRSDLLKPLLIGKKAPALVLADSNKKYIALHNLTGKYTIVYFWDPNCGHCQKETPKLYDVYKKYKDQGVQAYAVNIDRDRKKWIEYINKNDLRWINVYDPDYRISFKQLYDIYSTPVIYLLNEKKEIVAKRIGVEQVDEILGNMIKADKEKKEKEKKLK
jgi:peroxiredoxin